VTDRAALFVTLLEEPSRATQIPREEAVALLNQLSTLQVALLRAACSPAAPAHCDAERPSEDLMLDVDEAAALLSVTSRWLYRHAKELPFTRPISRRIVRFSRAGILRWLASRRP
jgi:excisionase family DNA binding protein